MQHLLRSICVRRLCRVAAAIVVLTLAGVGSAYSTMSGNFVYSLGTGIGTDMTGASVLSYSNRDDGGSGLVDIGFTFTFEKVDYTQFQAGVNGTLGFTSTIATTYSNDLGTTTGNPIIAPFWEDQHLTTDVNAGTGVFYKLTGTSPNRVLTIEWRTVHYDERSITPVNVKYRYQVRLYEGSNKIEYLYLQMPTSPSTTASIGMAANGTTSSSNNVRWVPAAGSATIFFNSSDPASVNIASTTLPANLMYISVPCESNIRLAGNTLQGGTAGMANNDNLLANYSVQRGNAGVRQPFTTSLGTATNPACFAMNYSYSITGSSASEYAITPASGTLNSQQSVTPTLTFTPNGVGLRPATLTVTDNNGFSRVFNLQGVGTTRVQYTGNVAQGGTATMANNDILMSTIRVDRLFTQNFQPFTVANTNPNTNSSYNVTYTITDPTGQYRLLNPNGNQPVTTYTQSLSGLQTSSPVIRFAPTGVGQQLAQLSVTTEDGTRNYTLAAYSRAAGADFFVEGVKLGRSSELFKKDLICVGEYAVTVPITVKNIGEGMFRIFGTKAFETDTNYGQGVPTYPLRRNGNQPVPTVDYFISEVPGIAPVPENGPNQYPVETPEAGQRTIYITFVPQHPGKRFTRLFINTNAANFTGEDENGVTRDGLLVLDLFGRGMGSSLSTSATDLTLPEPVVFPTTMVGQTVTETVKFYNPGGCDLRVERKKLRISSGDAADFKVLSVFPNAAVDQTNDTYILPPGDSGEITFSFTPSRSGSRRATILLQTNDSTRFIPGLTERGAYYLDIFGRGKVGLESASLRFDPVLIDGPTTEDGVASLENTAREVVIIKDMKIVGPDANEFAMDPSKPWPTVPFYFMPAQRMEFGFIHTPAAGSQPGTRNAELLLIADNGDTIRIMLTGEAGSRTLALNPTSLFTNASIPVGKSAREYVMITNNGTVPLRLGTTTIAGPNANSYLLGALPRLILQPGQTEYLEVVFRPVNPGASTATLTVSSDGTNGPQTVTLGGTGMRIGASALTNATSGVEDAVTGAGDRLEQSIPNPAKGTAVIGYELRRDGNVRLALYDAAGTQVAELVDGHRDAGRYEARVDVSGLAAGVYHYRLMVGGEMLSRTLVVVK